MCLMYRIIPFVLVIVFSSNCANFIAHKITRPISNAQMHNLELENLNLFYYTKGKENNPPLIFLHGILAFTEAYDPLMTMLSEKYFVIGIDLPGHGRSSIGTGPLSYFQISEYIIQLTNKLGIDKFYIIGHSAGGVVVLSICKNFPDKIIKGVTIASLYHYEGLRFENRGYNYLTEDGFKDNINGRNDFILKIFDLAHEKIGEKEKFHKTKKYMENLGTKIYPSYSSLELGNINIPIMVIVAENDEIIRASHTQKMADHLLDGKLLFIPNATHAGVVRSKKHLRIVCNSIFNYFEDFNIESL